MNSTTFRTVLVLWLFLSGLVSMSDPTDLNYQAAPSVLEYAEDVDVGETKLKGLSINAPINTTFVICVTTGKALRDSPLHIALQSSSLDRYQLLSTYRI